MMKELKGRSAVITGGMTGQGLAIARRLAAEGANVALGSFVGESGRLKDVAAYPDGRLADQLRNEISREGVAVHVGHLNVRDNSSIDSFLSEAAAICGKADILINAAGTSAEHPICDHPDDLWEKIIDTNLTGAFRMIRALLPGMIRRGFGRIINIGSTAASVGWKDNPAYCASKHGLIGLTKCVALEGAEHGVTCVAISPTWVETELMRRNVEQIIAREGKGRSLEQAMADFAARNPQKRIIQPEEVAALALFLCGNEARGITMENIQLTGGALW
jgi:NAD(P)-dependent dehydrogenase (short-subunit alcohol dehydrogenase family)